MKVVTDISDADYKSITENYISYADTESGRVYKAIKEGTVLPDNPTNGDMIEIMFPNCVKDNDFCGAVITSLNGETQYWKSDWWNLPYKGESNRRK